MKRYLPVILILLTAAAIRLYQFGDIPHGLNRDEASIGYTAYSLLNTGKEEHGVAWPLKFESFGDWKQPVYIYLLIPLIKALGLSEITVRLPSLLAGLVMIISVFLLTRAISGSTLASCLAATFLTLNPWHFHFSHLALEAMMAATLVSAGVLILIKSRKHSWTGVLLFVISLYTYHAAIIITPLIFVFILIANHKQLFKFKLFSLISALFFIILANIGYQGLFTSEKNKITGTTIFSMTPDQQWEEIYQYRDLSLLSKIIHNQYVYYLKTISLNYVSAFSPQFLIYRGGTHPHYNVPGFGNFYPIEIILSLVGAALVIYRRSYPGNLILIILLLAPLPAAITTDGVHSTRNIFMLPYLQILSGIGFVTLLNITKAKPIKYLIASTTLLMILIPSIRFTSLYWNDYRQISDNRFSAYMKPISLYIRDNLNNYQNIYLTYPFESPYIFYAFYTQMDPVEFQNEVKYFPVDDLGFRHASQLGKLRFLPHINDIKHVDSNHSLVLTRVNEINHIKILEAWNDLGGQSQIIAVSGEELALKQTD